MKDKNARIALKELAKRLGYSIFTIDSNPCVFGEKWNNQGRLSSIEERLRHLEIGQEHNRFGHWCEYCGKLWKEPKRRKNND